MLLIVVLVFLGVFTIVALPLLGSGLIPSRTQQQAQATLDSALKTESVEKAAQVALDLKKNESLSSIPWLNQRLLSMQLTPYLSKMLSQAALPWSAGRLMVMSIALFVVPAYVFYQYLSILPAALGVGAIAGLAPFGWVMFKRARRFSAFEKGLPEALDLMVSGLRAGHSLLAAIALVSRECEDPIGPEFKICFEEQNYGLEMKAALENLLNRVPLQDMKIVSTAILIQKESGGNLAEVLDKASYVIRERFRLKRQIMVHTAQGRLTGLILALLPVVLGVAIFFVDPDMISILWHRQIGIILMWCAFGLTVLGGLVIWKIVDIDV
jgi:tight adherence protein B